MCQTGDAYLVFLLFDVLFHETALDGNKAFEMNNKAKSH